MSKKRGLTLEFPLKVLSESGFPLDLLKIGPFLTFLRQDTYGFQISCKVQTGEVPTFKKKFEQYETVTGIERLYPAHKDGFETLLIRGRWLRNGGVNPRDRAAKMLRFLSACQTYFLRSPQVVGAKLRVVIEGEQSKIGQLLARFDRLKVSYDFHSDSD